MTITEWGKLFERLGIEASGVNNGRVLRYKEQSLGIYWNRNDRVGIYYSADPQHCYPSQLWQRVDPSYVKQDDKSRHNVMPHQGMEEDAFRHQLSMAE